MEREHESVILFVLVRKLVGDGILSDLDRDVQDVVGHGLDLINRDLNWLKELLLGIVEEADEFATFFVRPVGIVSQRNLVVDRIERGGNLDFVWHFEDLTSLDFVTTTAFPGTTVVLSLSHLVHPPRFGTTMAWSSSMASPATSGTTSATMFSLVFLPHVHTHLDHLLKIFFLILLSIWSLTRSLIHGIHEVVHHTKWIHWHVLGLIWSLAIIFNGSDQDLWCLSVLLDLQEGVWMWFGGLAVLTIVEVFEDGALVTNANDRTFVASIADDVVVDFVGVEGFVK